MTTTINYTVEDEKLRIDNLILFHQSKIKYNKLQLAKYECLSSKFYSEKTNNDFEIKEKRWKKVLNC